MKYTRFFLYLLFSISLLFAFLNQGFASAVDIKWWAAISEVSLNIGNSGDIIGDVEKVGLDIYSILKRFLMGVMVIYIVYIWAMMIMSMGSDEEQLSASKRQLWYTLVALIFINIPDTLYYSFFKDSSTSVGNDVSESFDNGSVASQGNLFFDLTTFSYGLNNQIIVFLEVMIAGAALFMLTLAGINLIASRGKEEKMTEAKNKIVYTVLALIFVGIIEWWKQIAFGGQISDGINLFHSLANLALYFTAPVAIFFLTLAGYYYITSNGDEERTKKAKSIVVNTLLASLILVASYTLLLDLANLPAPSTETSMSSTETSTS